MGGPACPVFGSSLVMLPSTGSTTQTTPAFASYVSAVAPATGMVDTGFWGLGVMRKTRPSQGLATQTDPAPTVRSLAPVAAMRTGFDRANVFGSMLQTNGPSASPWSSTCSPRTQAAPSPNATAEAL